MNLVNSVIRILLYLKQIRTLSKQLKIFTKNNPQKEKNLE